MNNKGFWLDLPIHHPSLGCSRKPGASDWPPGDVTSQTSLQRDRTGTARGGKAPMEVAFQTGDGKTSGGRDFEAKTFF